MIFSLQTDKTKDMYHHAFGLEHCDFKFSVMTDTLLNIQNNQFNPLIDGTVSNSGIENDQNRNNRNLRGVDKTFFSRQGVIKHK